MGTSLDEVVCSDVDYVAANGTGGVESQRLVLMDLVYIELLPFVHGSLVHSVRDGGIDQLAMYGVRECA